VVLDELNTHTIGEQLLALVKRLKARWFLVDMRNVAYLTSTGLGLFLRLRRELHAQGSRLTLCQLGPHLHEMFQVTNLHNLFDIRQRAEELDVAALAPTAGLGQLHQAGGRTPTRPVRIRNADVN
jgi:anti-anti-sigma factor